MAHSVVRRFAGLIAVLVLSSVAAAQPATASAADNNGTAYQYFVKKGLKGYQSAGIVGNLIQESGNPINPRADQRGGPGRGIAQWSEGDRWDKLVVWAGRQGRNPETLNIQLEFIWHELTTVTPFGMSSLRASSNVTKATQVFMTKFERCGQCESDSRVRYARQVLQRYGDGPSNPTPETTLPTLRKGSKSNAVVTAQHLLQSQGYHITADGKFGAKTRIATMAFQSSKKLGADGIIGPKTWDALLPTLTRGRRGDAVRGLQKQLNAHGAKLIVDGNFGAKTYAAVRAYQSKSKLAPDGVVGRNTWGNLID